MEKYINTYLNKNTPAAPLAVFRIGFGLMMLYSIIRFWANGWIETVYIEPQFHFSYYGFEWIPQLGSYTYILFIICGLAALFVALGYQYKLAIITFFLSFTWIELLEKTTYLNHYYFISILSFLMIFLPAHHYFSIDYYHNTTKKTPQWTTDSIKLLLGIVYFYAGIAKINSDWLLKAMPLKIWLPSKYDLPLIGENLMQQDWFHYAMSWSGMLYDILIPFLLWYRKTRWFAFILVVFFHVFTRVLFPIGVFPFVMIVSALIFFDHKFHERILSFIKRVLRPVDGLIITLSLLRFRESVIKKFTQSKAEVQKRNHKKPIYNSRFALPIIVVFFIVQLLFPLRYMLYDGELFWTEQGYRFSWRVMLMEKKGYASFKVVNGETGQSFVVNNSDFLTPLQEKQMSTQPDFIIEYAHLLKQHFKNQGHQHTQIYVDSYVALNGRPSQPYINPTVDLCSVEESLLPKTFILPFNDEIKGF